MYCDYREGLQQSRMVYWYVAKLGFSSFWIYVKEQEIWLYIIFGMLQNYLVDEKLKACKNILFFICSSAAVHLGNIWKEENDFVPQKIHSIENKWIKNF